jgi:hypothetical protein
MRMKNAARLLLAAFPLLAACTSVDVRPVAAGAALDHVCIVNNPKVTISDMVSVLRDGFSRHDIATAVVDEHKAAACDVTLTYTALRSWDFKPYISHAELRLWRGGRQIGAVDYHLKGKGGLSLTKWGTTREKMDPMIDSLLAGDGARGD